MKLLSYRKFYETVFEYYKKKPAEYSSSTVLLPEVSDRMWLQQFHFEIF